MKISLPHHIKLPHSVVFHENGIRVTHIAMVENLAYNKDQTWNWLVIHKDDVAKAFKINLEIVKLHEDGSESVLEDLKDYEPHATYAYI